MLNHPLLQSSDSNPPTPRRKTSIAVRLFAFTTVVIISAAVWLCSVYLPFTLPDHQSPWLLRGDSSRSSNLPTAEATDTEAVFTSLSGKKFERRQGRAGALYLKQPTLCDARVKQISGYFTIDKEEHKKYFFWFFESRANPQTDPTALWLSGGPGASSMLALLVENGPCTVTPDGSATTRNPHSWNNHANMLWVDQPAGTGFSMGTFDRNEGEVARDMYIFLHTFLEHFPQYNHKFFVTGESFGGHYVPAVAYRIMRENKLASDSDPADSQMLQPSPLNFERLHIDIQGIAIGNGMTNTAEQLWWYPEMAFNSGTAPRVIDEPTYLAMKAALPTVASWVDLCAQTNDDQICMEAWQWYSTKLMLPVVETKANLYDLRLKSEYNNSNLDTFLNTLSVREELGAKRPWSAVNVSVWLHLAPNDFLRSYHSLVPPLLDAGLKVLVYAGDQDYICNWLGNRAWTDSLKWSGKEAFNNLASAPWRGSPLETASGGELKVHKNLAFLRVAGAGHMVPMDQPRHSLEMFRQFISDELIMDTSP